MGNIDRFLELFISGQWITVISTIFVFIFILVEVIKAFKYLKDYFGIETQSGRRNKEIEELKENQNSLSDAIKEIKSTLLNTNDKLNEIDLRLQHKEQQDNLKNRAQLKDRINQAYHFYHNRGYWNSMEKEALDDLIISYEGAGGKNSFVHTIIEPESHEWEIRDK